MRNKRIINYTSTVPVEKSISHIEETLVLYGAKDIMKRYDSMGRLSSICFIILFNGREIPFKLPAKIDACNKKFKESVKKPRRGTWEKIEQQAERTAWKIISDWIDLQTSMIELEQLELLQAFMPHVYDPHKEKTFYEEMKETRFLALTK